MRLKNSRYCPACFWFILGHAATLAHAEPARSLAEVIVNADLTEEGRKIPRPTRDRPAYYVPVILGWQESGEIVAGDEPPRREAVLRHLGQALAREGYVLQAIRPDANRTVPSLIIAVEWGSLNPIIRHHGGLDLATGDGGTMAPDALRSNAAQAASTDFNQQERITLVAGSALQRQVRLSEQEWNRIRDAVAEGRYFVIVSAYDFAASLQGERKLLWRARMSTDRHGLWMNNVVAALVTAGAPLFGRQTDAPAWREFPLREGRVDLGELKVLETDVRAPAEKAGHEKAK